MRNEIIYILIGDGAITRKKNDGHFASCATHNDAVFRHFFRVILHHQTKKKIIINSFLKSQYAVLADISQYAISSMRIKLKSIFK
jgi:hypothetical protein